MISTRRFIAGTMDKVVKEGWSGEATLEKAEEMGFECEEVEIRDFVKNYVDSHV